MKPFASLLLLFLAACGGAAMPTPSAEVAPFIGTWRGTLVNTVSCGSDAPQSAATPAGFAIATTTGTDVTYTTSPGCKFSFQVSGSTATLSNGPVNCITTSGGVSTTLTVNSYTLTTTDGHTMTAAAAGTVSQSGTSCAFTSTGSVTK